MYKVFYNNSVIYIDEKFIKCENKSRQVLVKNKQEAFLFLDDILKQEKKFSVCLGGYQAKRIFEHVVSFFHFLEAAGGLVKNESREFLFIRRFGIWDLPKGKIEKDETPADAAIREVKEETGLGKLSIQERLSSTYHIYPHKASFVLKKTHWFLMSTNRQCQLVPQQEEDITEAVWLDTDRSRKAIQSSYRSLSENFLPFFQD